MIDFKNLEPIQVPEIETLRSDIGIAEQALADIYKSKSLDEAKKIAFIAVDKISLGSPERLLGDDAE